MMVAKLCWSSESDDAVLALEDVGSDSDSADSMLLVDSTDTTIGSIDDSTIHVDNSSIAAVGDC